MVKSSNLFLVVSIVVLGLGFLFTGPGSLNNGNQVESNFFEPELGKEIARLKIEQGDKSLDIVAHNKRWSLPAYSNFPVRASEVRDLLLPFFSVSDEQLISSNTAQYAEFGLTDQAVKKGRSRITLYNSGGDILAQVFVGDKSKASNGAYIRRNLRPGIYLTKDPVIVNTSLNDWIDKRIANIPSYKFERIEQYRVAGRSNKLEYALVRDSNSNPRSKKRKWTLEISGAYRKNMEAVTLVSNGLRGLKTSEMLSVKSGAAARLTFDKRTIYYLSNGLRYNLLSAQEGSNVYLKISIAFDQAFAKRLADKYQNNSLSSSELASRLNKLYQGWVFEIPLSSGQRFRQDSSLIATKISEEELRREKLAAERAEAARIAKLEAERIAKEEEEAKQAKLEAERKAQEEAARLAKIEAERQKKLEAEKQAQLDAERKAKEEADKQARLEAERKAEAERQATLEAERKAKLEAERQAKLAAERKAEAEKVAKLEAERKAQAEAARKAQLEAQLKAKLEAERRTREEAAKLAAQRQAQAEAARKAKLEAEQKAKAEAENRARAEAAKLAAQRKARAAAAKRAQIEAAREAQEEAARQAKDEAAKLAAERKARADAAKQAQAEADRQAQLEAERKRLEALKQAERENARLEAMREAERKAQAAAERRAKLEAQRRATAAARRKALLEARQKAIAKKQAEADKKAQLEREEAALAAAKQAEALRIAKEAAALRAAKEAAQKK